MNECVEMLKVEAVVKEKEEKENQEKNNMHVLKAEKERKSVMNEK